MKEEEKIQTLHPQGKKGVHILRRRYDMAVEAVIATLRERGDMTAMDLYEAAGERLEGRLDGNGMWYAVSAKLDLEARGILQTLRKKGDKQVVSLVKAS